MRERLADSHDSAMTFHAAGAQCAKSIERVEMMDWSMAVTDAQAIGRGNRRSHPGFGVANGGLQIVAFGKARRDGRGQRASGAVGVFGGDPWSRQRNDAGFAEKIIDALGALPVAALDQYRAATHRQQTLALTLDLAFA